MNALRLARQKLGMRAAIGVVVVGAVVSGGTVAALTLRGDRPDATEAAAVDAALSAPAAELHELGWRQELDAERVDCYRADVAGARLLVRTPASEFPLTGLLTAQILSAECASGTDEAREAGGHAGFAAVCVRPAAALRAVVVLGGGCDAVAGTRAASQSDLDRLNRMRALEVAMLSVPSASGCPTAAAAVDWAKAKAVGSEVALRVEVMDEGPACYRPVAYWDRSAVIVQALGPQPS